MTGRMVERPIYMTELEKLCDNRGYIKVITGVRRCGKSTLLSQFMDRLKDDGVSDKRYS